MSDNVFRSRKFEFHGYQNIYGFIAFDKNKRSVGIDEVCTYMDNLETEIKTLKEQNKLLREGLNYYGNRMDSGGTARETLKKVDELGSGEDES